MSTLAPHHKAPLIDLLLSVADDKLVLGQRNADWTGLGPILEEDIAFSALAQDDLAHAMALYEFIATLDGRRADDLAYGRAAADYRCAALTEAQDEFDWAFAIARQFCCDHFDALRLERLSHSSHLPLAQLAARMLTEKRLSLGHADDWVGRLASANTESRTRINSALTRVAPLTAGLFEPTRDVERLEVDGVYPGSLGEMYARWRSALTSVLAPHDIRLTMAPPGPDFKGGRRGVHSDSFAQLLDEMCEVYRVEPDASW